MNQEKVRKRDLLSILAVALITFAGILSETSMNVTFPHLSQVFGLSLGVTMDYHWLSTGCRYYHNFRRNSVPQLDGTPYPLYLAFHLYPWKSAFYDCPRLYFPYAGADPSGRSDWDCHSTYV